MVVSIEAVLFGQLFVHSELETEKHVVVVRFRVFAAVLRQGLILSVRR